MNLAAVWNDLLQGNLANIWHGIIHAHWSNVWGAISAIFTMLAVIVATWAMLRWRKQDELKSKMLFKQAIAEYLYVLVQLPDSLAANPNALSHALITPNINENIETLKVKIRACHNAWVAMEGLLENNKVVNENWSSIYDRHADYLSGKIKARELGECALEILEQKFIFK